MSVTPTHAGCDKLLRVAGWRLYLEFRSGFKAGDIREPPRRQRHNRLTVCPGPVRADRFPLAVRKVLIKGQGRYLGYWDAARRAGVALVGDERSPMPDVLAFLRQAFLRSLPLYHGVVLHAACVAQGGAGYVFAGRSGAGKTTVCALSGCRRVLSDDMTLVRKTRNGWRAWGWPPSPGARGVDIKAVLRLRQSARHDLLACPAAAGVAAMLVAPPAGAPTEYLERALDVCAMLAREVPLHTLCFARNDGFWRRLAWV